MNSGNTLVINLGLRSVRAVVFDSGFKKTAQSSFFPVRTFIHGDHVEQNPIEWWELTKRAVGEVMNKEIARVTVTSSSSCLVPVDNSSEPLTNAIMVSDKRSKKEAEEMSSAESLALIWNHQNFRPAASYMAPKIFWISRNAKKIFDDVGMFLGSNDYLIMKLSGRTVTDTMNAEKFYYDADGGYSDELLEFLGISRANLPDVKEVGHTVGRIDGKTAEELGLDKKTEITISTYDALCSFWGSGIYDYSVAANTCGTVSSVRVASQNNVGANNSGILSQHFPYFNVYVVGGSNNIEGGLLEWAKSCFYSDHQYKDTPYIYDLMNQEASESPAGSNGLIFLPYILGERMPFSDAQVRGVFFGLERYHSRKDIIRSIFESIGFMTLDMTKSIEKHGIPIRELRMSGGLSRNDLICRIKTDFTGKPVSVTNETETTSLGAAILSNLLIEKIDMKTAASRISLNKTFYPNIAATEKYAKLYEIFKNLHNTTSSVFQKRSSLVGDVDSFILENL